MVGIAPLGWAIAARELAMLIADHQGPTLGWRDYRCGSTQVEGLAVGAQGQHPDRGIAQQPLGHSPGHGADLQEVLADPIEGGIGAGGRCPVEHEGGREPAPPLGR